jgi:hypothetical protein
MPEIKVQDDISAIKGYLKKSDKVLIQQMLNGLDVMNDLPGSRRNVKTITQLNKMTVDPGVRPLNTGVKEAKGGRKWTNRELVPRFGMKIMQFEPEQLRETFQAEMMVPGAKRIPYEAWVMAREFEKIGQEINDNFYLSSFHGNPDDFDAGETYGVGDLVYFDAGDKRGSIVYRCVTITTAAQSPTTHPAKWVDVDNTVVFDGPGTIIANEIADSNLSAFAGGSFDDTTAYEAFKDQFDAIPEAYKRNKIAYCSLDVASDLQANVNKEFGSGKGIGGADLDTINSFALRNTAGRLTVKPVTWMGSSRRIIMTSATNIVPGTDMLSDFNSVGKVIETLHGYDAVVKYMLTCQIADLEDLYVNDQA